MAGAPGWPSQCRPTPAWSPSSRPGCARQRPRSSPDEPSLAVTKTTKSSGAAARHRPPCSPRSATRRRRRSVRGWPGTCTTVLPRTSHPSGTSSTTRCRRSVRGAARAADGASWRAHHGCRRAAALGLLLRNEAVVDRIVGERIAIMAEHLEARFGVRIEVVVNEGEGRLRPEVESELLRIAQEGMNNAVKRAQASVYPASAACPRAARQIQVLDDGVGLQTAGRLHGVKIMRERARRIGAEPPALGHRFRHAAGGEAGSAAGRAGPTPHHARREHPPMTPPAPAPAPRPRAAGRRPRAHPARTGARLRARVDHRGGGPGRERPAGPVRVGGARPRCRRNRPAASRRDRLRHHPCHPAAEHHGRTGHADDALGDDQIFTAMEAGASAFVGKSAPSSDVVERRTSCPMSRRARSCAAAWPPR